MLLNLKVIDLSELKNSFRILSLIYLFALAKHELLIRDNNFQWHHLTDSKQTARKIQELKATLYFLNYAKQVFGIRRTGKELKTHTQLFFYKLATKINGIVPRTDKKDFDISARERLQDILNNLMKFIQKLLWENSQRRIADLFNHPNRRRTG